MPAKYRIPVRPVRRRFARVERTTIIEWGDECKRCVTCVRWACPAGAYRERQKRILAEVDRLLEDEPELASLPEYEGKDILDTMDDLCQSCYRCIQNCPREQYLMVLNPEYERLGDSYWTPEIITATWYQAETGRIPVSGAGYGGPFAGPGFDSIWTDMSEIVRPTRDGIHGREYISTAIHLGRKPLFLVFDEQGGIAFPPSPLLEIPLPVLLAEPPWGAALDKVRLAAARAAQTLGTLVLVPRENLGPDLDKFAPQLVPSYTEATLNLEDPLLCRVRLAEIADYPGVLKRVEVLKKQCPELVTMIRVPADTRCEARVAELTGAGAEVIHLAADDHAQGLAEAAGLHLKDLIRKCHLRLVEDNLRDTVTLLASGGIAMAEHVAKAIICGVDGVIVDLPLLLLLECRLCRHCLSGGPCPVDLEKIDIPQATQRLVNLMGAWNNQLLEVLGAMGLREVRRLRGEVGRAMFVDELQREIFGPLFARPTAEGSRREGE
ncbi:MAG: hypothetical protein JRI59_04975 [Deltaproteobacteria bacterium]|nr:hypothetical protein [Deltaproteobacteria bacterium]